MSVMSHHSVDLKDLLTHHHVLLLQGKMGSFFSRFAGFLKKHNIKVSKVNFNAGDAYFYKHSPAYDFNGQQEQLESWLDELIDQHNIDAVVCFGDCRPHHLIARKLLEKRNIPLYVFEEGYLRPYYITLEKHGVNGFSRIKLRESDTQNSNSNEEKQEQPAKVKNNFTYMTLVIMFYYAVCWIRRKRFPHYQHYRNMTLWQEAVTWTWAPYYRFFDRKKDLTLQNHLSQKLSNKYFLVTLQVYNDFQITHHSKYDDVITFIDDVIQSFAEHANPCHHLLLKHHPMDRGQRHYARLIKQLTKKYGLDGRVHYGCDMHLPTMIKHSIGMVTINSTTGLQSMYHKKPVIAISDAVYNQPGLTAQCSLAEFWTNAPPVNHGNYLSFRNQLIETCQLNGAFYDKNPWMDVIYQPTTQAKDKMPATFHSTKPLVEENPLDIPKKNSKTLKTPSELDESAA